MKKVILICSFLVIGLCACNNGSVPADIPQSDSLASVADSLQEVSSAESLMEASVLSEPEQDEGDSGDAPDAEKYRNDSVQSTVNEFEQKYVGMWQKNGFGVGAGYDSRFLLFSDNTFIYAENQGLGAIRLRFMFGGWTAEDGVLKLVVKSKVYHEGGQETEPTGSMISVIEGGHFAIYIYEEEDYEYIEYSFTDIKDSNGVEISDSGVPFIFQAGDDKYYRISNHAFADSLERWENYLYAYRQMCLAFIY